MALHSLENARRRAGALALLLALCAVGQRADAAPCPAIMFAIGLTIGLLTLFRPILIAFVPLAVSRDRFKSLVLVVAGAGPPCFVHGSLPPPVLTVRRYMDDLYLRRLRSINKCS
jgi:hypothetical protein